MKNTCLKMIAVVAFALLVNTATGCLRADSSVENDLLRGNRPYVLTPLHTEAELKALHQGDTVSMVCGMCRSVTVVTYSAEVGNSGHVSWMYPGTEMECPMCGGTISVAADDEKQGEITHICTKCGGDSAFCCAAKKGQTKGQ